MASETKIKQFAQEAGYEPLEDRCIIVRPTSGNLSDKILLPFDPMWTSLRKDVSLVLPYGDIQSVELADDLLNTLITIHTGEDDIRLTTQQKELSDFRMSGFHATQYAGGYKNWHKENVEGTLKALAELGNSVNR